MSSREQRSAAPFRPEAAVRTAARSHRASAEDGGGSRPRQGVALSTQSAGSAPRTARNAGRDSGARRRWPIGRHAKCAESSRGKVNASPSCRGHDDHGGRPRTQPPRRCRGALRLWLVFGSVLAIGAGDARVSARAARCLHRRPSAAREWKLVSSVSGRRACRATHPQPARPGGSFVPGPFGGCRGMPRFAMAASRQVSPGAEWRTPRSRGAAWSLCGGRG